MHSLVFAVVLVLVAPLTVVRSEMNSSFIDDPTLRRHDRGTVTIGAVGSPPLIIGSGPQVNGTSNGENKVVFSSPASDPLKDIKPEDGIKLLTLIKNKRGQVDIGVSRNTAVFNKRGTYDFNSTVEEPSHLEKPKRGQVDIGYSRNTAVFNKRGQVGIGYSRNTAVFNKRGQVDIGVSRNTAVFNKRGNDFNSTVEEPSHLEKPKRGQVDIGFSGNTSVFNKRGTHEVSSTVEEPSDVEKTKRGQVGIGYSRNTSIFNQRSVNASMSA